MKIGEEKESNALLKRIESVSSEIQLLALNIAVAAAKLAHERELGFEVNQKLSQLVNQATHAVRQLNQVLKAAKTDIKVDEEADGANSIMLEDSLMENIENAMNMIIEDSERITKLLSEIKKK